jgi:hypothetical protein
MHSDIAFLNICEKCKRRSLFVVSKYDCYYDIEITWPVKEGTETHLYCFRPNYITHNGTALILPLSARRIHKSHQEVKMKEEGRLGHLNKNQRIILKYMLKEETVDWFHLSQYMDKWELLKKD